MSFLFTCPHCQTRTHVEDAYSGHRGRCVECHRDIAVPHFVATPEDDATGPAFSKTGGVATFVAASLIVIALGGLVIVGAIRIGGRSMAALSASRVRTDSITNLEKIALAMNNYASDHGTYPPPAVRSPTGAVLHSWRVLLLPYLGEDEIYNRYDLSVPWDDPRNLVLQWQIPKIYLHPESGGPAGWSPQSAYYLITGVGTVFPPTGPLSPDQVADRPSQTILIAEASSIAGMSTWLEPVDLDYAAMTFDLTNLGAGEIGGLTPGGATVATVDGEGHFISAEISPVTLQALMTVAGGEPLRDGVLD